MFKLFKDKLKSFFGKAEEKPKKIAKAKKEKVVKTKKVKIPSEKQLEKIEDNVNENIPSEFNKGTLKYEPDIEKLNAEVSENEIEAEIKEIEEKQPKQQSKGFLSKIVSKFTTSKIEVEQVDEIFQELEIILLENNVALEVVDKIKSNLINSLVGKEIKGKEIKEKIIQAVKESISDVLVDSPNLIQEIKNKEETYTILFFGINGTGKTTSIAKLASLLKKNNISCVLAAADTFRAAAIEQLEIHANNIKIPIIKSEYSSDPTSVAFEAKNYAEKNKIKCVLIDTAGRMYTKENLIKQMEKLIRVIKPDKKIFVGESTAGNDMLDQIKTFNGALGIDGIILSKSDIDEKGGTALSVSFITNKPIYFIGTGQKYQDLKEFKKQEILESLGF